MDARGNDERGKAERGTDARGTSTDRVSPFAAPVLWGMRRMGRWFALVPFALVLLLSWAWLSLLDTRPIWFLVLALPFVPVALAATALVLGMVFATARPSAGKGIEPDEAPELWAMVREAFGPRSRVRLFASGEPNASVRSWRGPLPGTRDRTDLVLGLPLLAALDREAFDAVIRHEAAHVHFKDTNGSRNVGEFYECFAFVFDFAPPDETVLGTLILFALEDFAALTHRAEMTLSRRAELRADRAAAAGGCGAATARALKLVSVVAAFHEREILEHLDRELLGAVGPVASPYERLMRRMDELADDTLRERMWQQALAAPREPDASHPSAGERLAALDENLAPPPWPFDRVLPHVVPPKLRLVVEEEIGNGWRDRFED